MVEFPMAFRLLAGAALLFATIGIYYTLFRMERDTEEERKKDEPEGEGEGQAGREEAEGMDSEGVCPFGEDCPFLRGEVDSCRECNRRPTGCPGVKACIWRAINVHACDRCPSGYTPREGGRGDSHGRDDDT